MPLDDRWDKLNDAEWASFADACLAEFATGTIPRIMLSAVE